MKKKIIKATLVATFAVIAGYNVYASQKAERLSDLALANVEALADGGETGGKFAYRLYPCPGSYGNACVWSDTDRPTCPSSSSCP